MYLHLCMYMHYNITPPRLGRNAASFEPWKKHGGHGGRHIRCGIEIDNHFNNGDFDLVAFVDVVKPLVYETPSASERGLFVDKYFKFAVDDTDGKEAFLYHDVEITFRYLLYNRKVLCLNDLRFEKFEDFKASLDESVAAEGVAAE